MRVSAVRDLGILLGSEMGQWSSRAGGEDVGRSGGGPEPGAQCLLNFC